MAYLLTGVPHPTTRLPEAFLTDRAGRQLLTLRGAAKSLGHRPVRKVLRDRVPMQPRWVRAVWRTVLDGGLQHRHIALVGHRDHTNAAMQRGKDRADDRIDRLAGQVRDGPGWHVGQGSVGTRPERNRLRA